MRNPTKYNLRLGAIYCGVLAMFVAGSAMADDEELKALTQPKSTVQVEMIGVDQNSAKFGEYNGLYGHPSGAYPNGALNVRGGSAYTNNEQGGTTRWSVTGDNLGLTSRSANASVAEQGSWNIGVNYDQLQHNTGDSFSTPYQGTMGQNRFALPSGMAGHYTDTTTSSTNSALQGMSISSTRYNTTVNAGSIIDKNWNLFFEYNNLIQTGAKLQGVAGAQLATGAVSGNSQTISIMPMPTNYTTDTINLGVNWKGDNSHFTASYFGSFFQDGYNQFNFQAWNKTNSNPTTTPWQTMSTMPSNALNQLNLAGGYDFSTKTKLTGNASISQNTQNQGFGGTYDAGMAGGTSLTGALPAQSLNGLVNTTHADLKLTDQSISDLTITAAGKYDVRDNLTQSNMYTVASVNTQSAFIPNTPMSIKQTQLSLGGSYRVTKDQKVDLTLGNSAINRWCNQYGTTGSGASYTSYYNSPNCVAGTSSNENKADLLYKIKAIQDLDLKFGLGYANRISNFDNSVYVAQAQAYSTPNTYGSNYPGYVPFFEASQRQLGGKVNANWQANDRLSFSLGGKYANSIYPNSTYGVQNGTLWSANLDGTYAYTEEGSVVGYVTQQGQQRNLANLGASGGWTNNMTTNTTTIGLGVKQGGLVDGRLTLTGDATYSKASTYYTTGQGYTSAPACNATTTQSCGIFPAIANNLAIIKLGGVYQIDKSSKVGVMYWYQRLSSSDYVNNAYQFGYSPSGIMPTNQTNPSYNVNVISANYTYTFD